MMELKIGTINQFDLIFVTVNYNNFNITRNFVECINSFGEYKIKIVIVDNSSKEDKSNLEKLSKISNVTVIFSDENVGYFRGLNLGLNYIEKNQLKSKYLFIGNNDLIFSDNFVKNLLMTEYAKDIGCIAPDIVTIDNIHQNPHLVHRVSFKRKLMYDLYFLNYYLGTSMIKTYHKFFKQHNSYESEKKEIYAGIGAGYILTTSFFEKFKELDARVFLWGEEALLANQLKSSNLKMLYDPNLIIQHLESATTGKIGNKTKYYQSKESYKIYRDYL